MGSLCAVAVARRTEYTALVFTRNRFEIHSSAACIHSLDISQVTLMFAVPLSSSTEFFHMFLQLVCSLTTYCFVYFISGFHQLAVWIFPFDGNQ